MKKLSFVIAVLLVGALVLYGCAKGYDSQKTAGDLKIGLSIERYPLIKGDNALTVQVMDASGKPVTDAAVSVHYFMPAMPGMAPMEYTAQAVLKGDRYALSANIPMEGGWKAEVSVTKPGKSVATAMFNVDAR